MAESEPGYEKHVALVDKVKKVTKYNPAHFSTAIGCLKDIGEADQPFDKFMQEVSNAKDALHPDKWDGKAASDFRKNVLNAYDDIRDTQLALVGNLLGALKGYQKALEDTHETYSTALKQTKDAAQAIVDSNASSANVLDTAVLTATIAVAGAAAAGSGMTFSLASGGVSIGSAALSAGGSSVNKIHANLFDALDGAKAKLDELDDELAKGMKSDHGKVTDGRHKPETNLDFPRPGFVDDPSKF